MIISDVCGGWKGGNLSYLSLSCTEILQFDFAMDHVTYLKTNRGYTLLGNTREVSKFDDDFLKGSSSD
jgi:hypothetical protein